MEINKPIVKQSNIDEKSLFFSIWLKPTNTLKHILSNYPEKYVTILIVLGSIIKALDKASTKDMGDRLETPYIIIMAIIAGALFGWISYYISAWAMSEAGIWLGGKAKPTQFRTVLAWASVPLIASGFLLILELFFFGDDVFKSEIQNIDSSTPYLWVFFGILELILGIWALVILVKGISLIQDFKTGKAILNMIFPGIIVILIILIAVGLFSLIS